ncbi:MAG: tRNA pseudouridine(55) synthase TruB [Oscillospiraceae bacterium]
MQGIIIVDKPVGFTSFDVVAKLRGILQTKKIGHSGTLDPMATGVLPCFVGRASKAVDMQECHDKGYEATVRFGISTDTGDITGTILNSSNAEVNEADFLNALQGIVGKQSQLPPMYSAVKVNGQPLYKAARKGETVERTPRNIEVYIAEYRGKIAHNEYSFYVECSKGTYVRTLCEDLGERLCVPAAMSALRRVKSGVYTAENAYSIDEIQKAKNEGRVEALMQNASTVFAHLPKYELNKEGFDRLLNGAICKAMLANGRYQLVFENNFVGVCSITDEVLDSVKLFCERE